MKVYKAFYLVNIVQIHERIHRNNGIRSIHPQSNGKYSFYCNAIVSDIKWKWKYKITEICHIISSKKAQFFVNINGMRIPPNQFSSSCYKVNPFYSCNVVHIYNFVLRSSTDQCYEHFMLTLLPDTEIFRFVFQYYDNLHISIHLKFRLRIIFIAFDFHCT